MTRSGPTASASVLANATSTPPSRKSAELAIKQTHYRTSGDAADALARTASSVFDLLRTTLESDERELQLVEAQDFYAHPRMQFEVTRVR